MIIIVVVVVVVVVVVSLYGSCYVGAIILLAEGFSGLGCSK